MVFLICLKRTRQMQTVDNIKLRGWDTFAPVRPEFIYPLTKGEINYVDCPQYYYLKYIERKKPTFEESKITLQGTILHEAISGICDFFKGILFSSKEPEAAILDFDYLESKYRIVIII